MARQEQQRWKRFRHRLEYFGLWLISGFIPLLSRRACVAFARGLGSLAFALDKRGRAVALANLHAVFGDEWTPEKREAVAKASYQTFARTMVDLFWAPRLTRENFSRYVEFENPKAWEPAFANPKLGPIVLSPHLGNFEWGAITLSFREDKTGSIVAENFKNPSLTAIFNKLRGTSGNEIIPQEMSVIRLLKNVKRGRASGLLPDLAMPLDQPAVILETFGGLKLRATLLHAVIVQRTGTAIAPFIGIPRPDGTTLIREYPPLDIPRGADIQEISQRCWDFVEARIREYPELWMWAYKHWRYRPKNAGREYPFYSNESGKFERELKAMTGNGPEKSSSAQS